MLNKIKNYIKAVSWPILFYIGQVFILVAIFITLKIINKNIEFVEFTNNNSYIVSILNLIIFLPIFIKIYQKYKNKYKGKPKNIIKLILVGFILSLSLNYIIYLIKPENKINLNIFYIINISIIGPILEEYLFRGIVYNRLLEFNSEKKAYYIEVVFFAIIHGNILNILYAFIMGMILTKIYVEQKSLKSSILFHIIINTISSVVFPLMLKTFLHI